MPYATQLVVLEMIADRAHHLPTLLHEYTKHPVTQSKQLDMHAVAASRIEAHVSATLSQQDRSQISAKMV